MEITPNTFVETEYMSTASLDIPSLIRSSQPKVFTIYTIYGQGSGFLIDNNGHVLTNAHVVDGDVAPIIRTKDGKEYEGKLIGYSNVTDVAIIHVGALVGMEPLILDETNSADIGDEVIALGSPRGYENTATTGNISGMDRNFVIPPFQYNGVYQISAPIAPGSSGGPLLSTKTGKVIAINSAQDMTDITISFSIPIYQVLPLINKWMEEPMLENDIYALFTPTFDYYSDFDYFYDEYDGDYFWYDFWDEDWYLEDEYWEYWENDEWFWEDYYDEEFWDGGYNDWYWDNEYDDEYLDEYDDDWDDNNDDYWYDDEFWNDDFESNIEDDDGSDSEM